MPRSLPLSPGVAAIVVMVMTAFAFGAAESNATFPAPSELPSSAQPPDPLVCLDGTRVTSKQIWEARRKPELRALFQHYMYGYFPPAPKTGEVRFTVEREDKGYFGGTAPKKEVTI